MRSSFRAAVAAPLLAVVALAGCAGDGSDDDAETDADAAQSSVGEDEGSSSEDGSAEPAAPLEPVDLADGVAATVGDVEIARERVDQLIALRGVDSVEDNVEVARQVIGQLVQIELVSQQAEAELGLDLGEEIDGPAVSARADEIIEAAGGQEAFEATAATQGVAAENARQLAEEDASLQLLIETVQTRLAEDLPDSAVDEQGIRDEFEDDPSTFQSSDVAHILVETEQEAQDALARIEDGEDFAALAEELSTGPSGPQGGELGVQPRGQYVEPFSDAIYAEGVEGGDLVGPVETEFGWHVIRVNEIITPSLDEVIEEARLEAAAGALNEFAVEAFETRDVAVDEDFGVWDPVNSTVVAV